MNLTEQSSTSTEVNPMLRSVVTSLFDEMLLAYGKKFTDQWGAADPDRLADHWALKLSGYTPREIKRGIAALEGREWPPTLPEFKKLCRPAIDPLVAYYEAIAGIQERSKGEIGTWSHPAIFWASMPLSFDLNSQTYSQIRGRWEKSLSDQLEKGEWEPVPKVVLALAPPSKPNLSKTEASKRLNELGADAIVKSRKEDTTWYRKILEREKAGDKTLTMIQKRFAREAADLHGWKMA